MKVEKKIIAEGSVARSSEIQVFYDDGSECTISSIHYKENDRIYYDLHYSDDSEAVKFAYRECIKLLEKKYNINIFPIYYDDSESFISVFNLGAYEFELCCDGSYHGISLYRSKGDIDSSFSDDLAIYIEYNLIQFVSQVQKKTNIK